MAVWALLLKRPFFFSPTIKRLWHFLFQGAKMNARELIDAIARGANHTRRAELLAEVGTSLYEAAEWAAADGLTERFAELYSLAAYAYELAERK